MLPWRCSAASLRFFCACRQFRSTADSVAGLAKAKEKIDGQSASWASVLKSAVPFLLTAGAGTAAWAFYDGLWVPLLRDGQTASEVELISEGLLPESLLCWVAERLLAKEVVVLDGVVPPEQLAKIQKELQLLASRPGALQPNPKMKAGNMQIRVYPREPTVFATCAILHPSCHWRPEVQPCAVPSFARATGASEAQRRNYSEAMQRRALSVTFWLLLGHSWPSTLRAVVSTSGTEMVPGQNRLSMALILTDLGLWMDGDPTEAAVSDWNFVSQRGVEEWWENRETHDWPKSAGGALRCKATAAVHRGPAVESHPPVAEILPKGGRLVLFDSHSVEHEVVSTNRDRWALTAWFHE
eukprot:s1387_g4.t2